MKPVFAQKNYALLHDDGKIHYPFTKFLTDKFANPHTRELVSQSLRVLYRFCKAHRIELVLRAAQGRCFTYDEAKRLGELCYVRLAEMEEMGDPKLILLTSARAGKAPKDRPFAVGRDTASKRMNHIAQYLDFYREVFLDPNIRSSVVREHLLSEYDKIGRQLRTTIRGTKQSHYLAIKSLPSNKYLAIVEALFVRPEACFQANSGKPSRTLLRDRAIALLACEGLRPGTIGNLALADFCEALRCIVIKDNRAKRSGRITTNTLKLKMGDSDRVNNASETMIKLWPITVDAIKEYIEVERSIVLMKRLANRSEGFLFLNVKGQPINHRSSITKMFGELGKRLSELGLLDIRNDSYFLDQKKYDFYGYVLRHSAASFFLKEKSSAIAKDECQAQLRAYKHVPDRVKDLMKLRFGWTKDSKMPELYAARALSDDANVELMEFNKRLLSMVAARKRQKEQ